MQDKKKPDIIIESKSINELERLTSKVENEFTNYYKTNDNIIITQNRNKEDVFQRVMRFYPKNIR